MQDARTYKFVSLCTKHFLGLHKESSLWPPWPSNFKARWCPGPSRIASWATNQCFELFMPLYNLLLANWCTSQVWLCYQVLSRILITAAHRWTSTFICCQNATLKGRGAFIGPLDFLQSNYYQSYKTRIGADIQELRSLSESNKYQKNSLKSS